jgi:hypothetical protein
MQVAKGVVVSTTNSIRRELGLSSLVTSDLVDLCEVNFYFNLDPFFQSLYEPARQCDGWGPFSLRYGSLFTLSTSSHAANLEQS